MKTPNVSAYQFTPETLRHANQIPVGTIAEKEHKTGMMCNEPLIIGFDAMLVYARSYESRYNVHLQSDGVLGADFLSVITGLRGLLNGNGASAMRSGRSGDSKDNGACEAMFWECMRTAGFTEADL